MSFKIYEDLQGILRIDPNSFLPFRDFFSKETEEDLVFFAHLCCSILILSEKYEELCFGCNYADYEKKYGPIGNIIRDAIELNPFHPSQQNITDILKLLFEGQTFTENQKVLYNTTKSTNKILVDIRKKGGEYPYHHIVDIIYYIDPKTESFKGIKEENAYKEIQIKEVFSVFSKKIEESSLDRPQEWVNFFNALVYYPRGPGYDSMLVD